MKRLKVLTVAGTLAMFCGLASAQASVVASTPTSGLTVRSAVQPSRAYGAPTMDAAAYSTLGLAALGLGVLHLRKKTRTRKQRSERAAKQLSPLKRKRAQIRAQKRQRNG